MSGEGKSRWSLVPPRPMADVVDVLTFGAVKHSDFGYLGIPKEQLFDAAHRHLNAYRRGEGYDTESGKPHLAHAVASLLCLMHADEEAG